MTILDITALDRVTGGAGSSGPSSDPISAAKRAADQKAGRNSLDIYGYSETDRQGLGGEYRRRLNPNTSIFLNGHVGTKDNKPDNGVMGGIRFEW
jgi:hypothetical protein